MNSEDGEKLSGAGIYNSVVVNYDRAGKFDAFKKAVVSIFETTNSQRAVSYRKENGVGFEEMGLVIQRLSPDKYASRGDRHKVIVNSSAPGVPGLTEVAEDDQRFFVKKYIVDQNLASGIPEHAVHFRPDSSRSHAFVPHALIRYTVVSYLLERIWGGSIQFECIGDGLVQIRRVSDAFSGEVVEFPDEEAIARGNGVGTGDKVLRILPSGSNNNKRRGLVQFDTNDEWSIRGSSDYLPRDGAVVIQRDGGYNGHIQTLCVERGLLCMYPNEGMDEVIPQLKIGAQVRIVSNGVEARMYQVSGREDPVVKHKKYRDFEG